MSLNSSPQVHAAAAAVLAAGSSAPCSVLPTPWVLSCSFVAFGDFPESPSSPVTLNFS